MIIYFGDIVSTTSIYPNGEIVMGVLIGAKRKDVLIRLVKYPKNVWIKREDIKEIVEEI